MCLSIGLLGYGQGCSPGIIALQHQKLYKKDIHFGEVCARVRTLVFFEVVWGPCWEVLASNLRVRRLLVEGLRGQKAAPEVQEPPGRGLEAPGSVQGWLRS